MPPGDFAADRNAAMAVLHDAILNDDVLAGHVDAPAVPVAARFDSDTVVAGAENATDDEHAVAAFRIAAIVVRAVAVDIDAAHCNVAAQHRIELPHRGVLDGEVFEKNVRTAIGLDEVWAKKMSFAEDALGDGSVFIAHGDDSLSVVARGAGPRPPVLMIGLAIQRSRAGHGDIGFPEGIDKR